MPNLDSMDFDQLVPKNSKYLSKEDVGEDGAVLTIKGFQMDEIKNERGEFEEKIILYFEEDVKPMVVNRTNAQLLKQITGAKTAGEARGKRIVVYNDPSVQFGGEIKGGIRVKRIPGAPRESVPKPAGRGPAKTRVAGAAPPAAVEEFQDDAEIPF